MRGLYGLSEAVRLSRMTLRRWREDRGCYFVDAGPFGEMSYYGPKGCHCEGIPISKPQMEVLG
jgi:hypothetical protein